MKRLIIIIWLIVLFAPIYGQSTLNFGINERQKEVDLPKTKAPAPIVVRKDKKDIEAQLTPVGSAQYSISKGWEIICSDSVVAKPILDSDYNTSSWFNAVVPGTVLTTLVEQGVYPDPYIGLNNMLIPESLSRSQWWYRVRFDAPDEKYNNASLLFNGINYRAKIWLNGKFLGDMAGAFRRGVFNVSDVLKQKDNVLAVLISPPDNPGIGHEENEREFGPNGGALCLDGATFIASEGWDWMPAIRDRNMGIWQDVLLCYDNGVQFGDSQIITDLNLPDKTKAYLKFKIPVINRTSVEKKMTLSVKGDGIAFEKDIVLKPDVQSMFVEDIVVENPRLWYPNGYGSPELYNVELKLSDGTTKKVRFGIRELSYGLMVDTPEKSRVRVEYSPVNVQQKGKILFDYTKLSDANVVNKNTFLPSITEGTDMTNFKVVEGDDNPYLVIMVNGEPVFCRGGNWGMDDAMKRCSREQLEPAFKLHKLAGFNMIRNWTGESTEEVLYDLCDEYGILVWNDFWMSTGKYNLLPLDWDLFLANVKDCVKRFANHPSIAIWCPRNEGYGEGLEDDIHSIIVNEDGTRHYHGNSRELNLPGSGPWGYHDKPSEYFTRLAHGFNSELGSNSVPPYHTFKKFIAKEDEWPIGDAWYYHDYHIRGWSGWNAMERDMARLSNKKVDNAKEYCDRSQLLNYNGHKVMIEAYNNKMWNGVSGVLYWLTHPAWYSLICQAYSYDFETFGTFYGLKSSCEPTHIQWNIVDHKVSVVNASLKSYDNARVYVSVCDLNGKLVSKRDVKIDITANKKIEVCDFPMPDINELLLLRLVVKDTAGNILSQNDYWCKDGYSNAPEGLFDIKTADVKLTCTRLSDDEVLVAIKNNGDIIAPYVAVRVADRESAESILPAYADNNYFNLLPRETREIRIKYNKTTQPLILDVQGVNCSQKKDIK